MRIRSRVLGAVAVAVTLIVAGLITASPARPAALTEVTNFGANPTGLRMHLYVPTNVRPRPPILVAVHYCTGSGPAFHAGTEFASLADQYGFVVIYPSATRSGSCFDVSSPQALRHDGGSDPVGIVSMVRYVQQRNNGDPDRVYVTGSSSGAMMTNVLLGAYPDVFKAGAAFAGVPFGCFATTDGSGWNSSCANGTLIRTPQQWGDLVRAAYPGYSGPRPRMQVWHGTQDDTLRYPNFTEQIKQWTNVHGLGQTPTSTDRPRSNWTRTRYGTAVEAISLDGVGHNIPAAGMAAMAVQFLGLDDGGPTSSPTVTPTTSGPCRVTYTMNSWNTGFTAAVTITNTGTATITTWSLAFALPAGQSVTSAWNAGVSPSSGDVTARDAGYNATIPPGGSATFGFQATHNGNTAEPTSFTLGGSPCEVA